LKLFLRATELDSLKIKTQRSPLLDNRKVNRVKLTLKRKSILGLQERGKGQAEVGGKKFPMC